MTTANSISKLSKVFCLIGSGLLLLMAIFHGSGFFYIREEIEKSNTDEFLKEIIPTLFAHPSIHLLGLAAFGIIAMVLKQDAHKIAWIVAAMISIDAVLAFYLGGIIPGFLLATAAICFAIVGSNSMLKKDVKKHLHANKLDH